MNPFRDTIVASAWDATQTDVAEIHSSTFEECLRGLERVRVRNRSAALLIHGEAGSGKTHLLNRLRARLTPTAPIATDRDESLFVWVRLQTSPRMIWRTLRRTLVEDWFRPVANGRPQIDRILFHRLAAIRPAEWDLEPWYEYMLDENPKELAVLVGQIADSLNLDRNMAVAFEHITFGRHRRDLKAWLAGTSLPESVLERMELGREDGTEEELEAHARQVVLMLCHLTGENLPILLSFDQVEALQTSPADQEALFAFGQVVSTLHDATKNVLLVSSVQSSFATKFQDHAREADYDRMTSLGAYSLDPLNKEQALHLIAGRLQTIGDSPEIPSERAPCWPLEEADFERMFASGAISPRKLLSLCAESYEKATTPPLAGGSPSPTSPTSSVDSFLEEILEQGIEEQIAENTPDKTEEIVQHGLPQVVKILAPAAKVVRDDQLPDLSLIFEAPQGRLGLSVCTQSNMNSLQSRFKRLKTQFATKRLKRLVLIRDDRVPMTPGAKKARQYLGELEEMQAVTVFPQVEALAALDALRKLLSNAKAGDLSFKGESVTPETVGEWLQTHLPRTLQELSDEVLGGFSNGTESVAKDSRDREALNSLLSENPVMAIEEAARALGRTAPEITALARESPEHFVVLGSPADTIFRATEKPESV